MIKVIYIFLTLENEIKLFLSFVDFIKYFKITQNENDVILHLKNKIDLEMFKTLNLLLNDKISLFNNLSHSSSIQHLFKIAIDYDVEMLKFKNNYFVENNVDIHYIFLGPDFIVSSTQPALGMVYKLMEMNTIPCIKFSEEKDKQTIPGSKSIFRLYDSNNNLIGDYLSLNDEHENLGNKNTLDAL